MGGKMSEWMGGCMLAWLLGWDSGCMDEWMGD